MRRKTRTCRQQVMLFPTVVQSEKVPIEVKDALADLLLEALKAETRMEGGGDDEHEGHA